MTKLQEAEKACLMRGEDYSIKCLIEEAYKHHSSIVNVLGYLNMSVNISWLIKKLVDNAERIANECR